MVDLKAELRAEGGRVVREATEQRSSTEVRGGGGYGFAGRLPLTDLEPGLYVLHVEGRSRAGRERGARAAISRCGSSSLWLSGSAALEAEPEARSLRVPRPYSDRRVRGGGALSRLLPQAPAAGARPLQHPGAGGRRPADCRALRLRQSRHAAAHRLRHRPAGAAAERVLRLGRVRRQPAGAGARRSAGARDDDHRVARSGAAEPGGGHRRVAARRASAARRAGRVGDAHRRAGDRDCVFAALRTGGDRRRGNARRVGGDGRHRGGRADGRADCDVPARTPSHRHADTGQRHPRVAGGAADGRSDPRDAGRRGRGGLQPAQAPRGAAGRGWRRGVGERRPRSPWAGGCRPISAR